MYKNKSQQNLSVFHLVITKQLLKMPAMAASSQTGQRKAPLREQRSFVALY